MDAAFLAMERPAEPRHLGSVSIFGPSAAGPLTYDVVGTQSIQQSSLSSHGSSTNDVRSATASG